MRTLPAQQGVSLLVVVVVVLLCALLVLASTQAARLSEMLAGNDSEASRAFEAAEALLHDAELDVLGLGPQGQACQPDPAWVGCCSPVPTEGPGTGSRCCPTTRGPPPPGGIWRSGRPRRPTPSSSASPPWCRGGGQVPAPCCSPCWYGKCWAAPEAAEGEYQG